MTNVLKENTPIMSVGDPPKSILMHKFRELDKNKWIVNKNFIV